MKMKKNLKEKKNLNAKNKKDSRFLLASLLSLGNPLVLPVKFNHHKKN
jgi:hypothetical protein